ncbi:MAG: hypothetical protein NT086_20410 [Proteobacteria bacterium]|nr:hypothetical protein [Pseudomonadota bacterium]
MFHQQRIRLKLNLPMAAGLISFFYVKKLFLRMILFALNNQVKYLQHLFSSFLLQDHYLRVLPYFQLAQLGWGQREQKIASQPTPK